ncbi:hypothetical protein pb186bvf_017209 [Paramecium bursaria]
MKRELDYSTQKKDQIKSQILDQENEFLKKMGIIYYLSFKQANKQYAINPDLTSYTYGQTTLKSSKQQGVFRVFKDSDLQIPLYYQEKVQKHFVDEDAHTTASQVENANQQNLKDVVKTIYNEEKQEKQYPTADSHQERLVVVFGSQLEKSKCDSDYSLFSKSMTQ